MIMKIGVIAGEIWRLLEREDRVPLSKLLSKVGKDITEDEKIIYMGIGWLVREGYIVLEKTDSDYIAHLREPSSEKI